MNFYRRMIYLFLVLQFLYCTSTDVTHNTDFRPDNNIEILTIDEIDLLSLVNEYRYEHGVDRLNGDLMFHQIAYQRNIDNSINGYISHDGFGTTMQPIFDMGMTAGENLGFKYSLPETVFKAWIESESHRENILKESWLYTGISIYIDDNGDIYYCQIFVK